MNWDTVNWIDVILGATIFISALVGIVRGFLKEVLSLVAWVLAIYVAYTFSDMVAQDYIQKFINDKLISYIAAFGGIFLTVLFVIGLLNLLISQILKNTGLGFIDRFLGLILGVVRGVLIAALMVFMLSFVGNPREFEQWRNSKLAPYLVPVVDWGLAHIPKSIADRININNNPEDYGVLRQHNATQPPLTLESLQDDRQASDDNPAGFQLESVQDLPRNNAKKIRDIPEEPVLKLESTAQ